MHLTSATATQPSIAPRHATARAPTPPAIVLGGAANALSVVRSLGRAGVPVYVLNEGTSHARHSRYARWIRLPRVREPEAAWEAFLLGPDSNYLRGAVLLNCCDHGIDMVARHREELAAKFVLEEADPDVQLSMLNKLTTYHKAVAAGVPTPRFWLVQSAEQIEELKGDVHYPLLVKPLYSHLYQKRFEKRLVIAGNFEELRAGFQKTIGSGVEMMLVEMIPGGDDQLRSYYTYLDEHGAPLFHFTKRVIRRYPAIRGNGCYHITDWNPEVAELGLKFFHAVGIRGLANIEFKRDPRDGQLKLIECNARFTAANCLVADSGIDLALFVYNRLTGRPQPAVGQYRSGLRLWNPVDDFLAFRQLNRTGRALRRWLASIAHRQTFPYFRWYDPWPSMAKGFQALCGSIARGLRRLFRRAGGVGPLS